MDDMVNCSHCSLRPSHCRGLCYGCYRKLLRYGDPAGGRHSAVLLLWLEASVATSDRSTCWEWPFSRLHGYGQVGGRKATHVALELDGRPRPSDDLIALHSCDNPPCVNPDHLRWGTHRDNASDRGERGRTRNQWTGRLAS